MNGDDRKRWEQTFQTLGRMESDIKTLFTLHHEYQADIKHCQETIEKSWEHTQNNKLEIVKLTTQLATIVTVALIAINLFL